MMIDNFAVKFGRYGGLFVPETLVAPLADLSIAYDRLKKSPQFQDELKALQKDFAGRPTSL
jgi:tryptophan synthase beta chain